MSLQHLTSVRSVTRACLSCPEAPGPGDSFRGRSGNHIGELSYPCMCSSAHFWGSDELIQKGCSCGCGCGAVRSKQRRCLLCASSMYFNAECMCGGQEWHTLGHTDPYGLLYAHLAIADP